MNSWMQDLKWLHERRTAIIRRIELEDTEFDPDPPSARPPSDHGGRTARRDALKVIDHAIAKLA